VTQLVEALR